MSLRKKCVPVGMGRFRIPARSLSLSFSLNSSHVTNVRINDDCNVLQFYLNKWHLISHDQHIRSVLHFHRLERFRLKSILTFPYRPVSSIFHRVPPHRHICRGTIKIVKLNFVHSICWKGKRFNPSPRAISFAPTESSLCFTSTSHQVPLSVWP